MGTGRASGWQRLAAMVAAVAVVAPASPATSPATTTDGLDATAAAVIARYRERIPALMVGEGIPGLAVALVDGDRVLWAEGFGTTDAEGGHPVTADTMFSVQSMSKLFTATAVMQAVDAGRLDLDVPITTYLPEFTVNSAFEADPQSRITLRMLLGHTAGFTHEAPIGNNYERDPGTQADHLRTISETWLRFPVGTGYAYSNQGIDLAAAILERVSGEPFPAVVEQSLLDPLAMDHSTFDRDRIAALPDRAVGHGNPAAGVIFISPMMGAGGLWTTARDLARFLRYQLGDGVVDGTTVLAPSLMEEMRTVPAPRAGAGAGYALGVARTRWRRQRYVDLFTHGGGGQGFLASLYWAPRLGLGVAVLTNDANHDVQETLPISILGDLVSEPGTYRDRLEAIPAATDVPEPDSHWDPPADLAARIASVAMAPDAGQADRWAAYVGTYRTGSYGGMSPSFPPSRFLILDGAPVFDAAEDGSPVRHALTEVRPGVFLAENGETLDLRGPQLLWRGINLVPVTNGPLPWQWALLMIVGLTALAWLIGGTVALVRGSRRREARATVAGPACRWRRTVAVVASLAAITALGAILTIVVEPTLTDVGFLGWLRVSLAERFAFHAPLAVALLAVGLVGLAGLGWARGWWSPRSDWRLAAVTIATVALTVQLVAWHLVGWGFG